MPPVIDPRNLDIVAAVLTIPVVNRFFDKTQEGKYLEHEYRMVAKYYLELRKFLEEEDNNPTL